MVWFSSSSIPTCVCVCVCVVCVVCACACMYHAMSTPCSLFLTHNRRLVVVPENVNEVGDGEHAHKCLQGTVPQRGSSQPISNKSKECFLHLDNVTQRERESSCQSGKERWLVSHPQSSIKHHYLGAGRNDVIACACSHQL